MLLNIILEDLLRAIEGKEWKKSVNYYNSYI